VIVQAAWIAVILLPALVILGESLFGTDDDDASDGVESQRKAGLAIVRVAWIAAILVPVLIILGALFSGNGGDSSRQSSEVSSAPPAAPSVGVENQKTKTPAPQTDHSQRAIQHALVASHPSSRTTATQPGDVGGEAPAVTPQPKPTPSPVTKPPRAPQPKPTPTPAPSQPPVAETPTTSVQTTTLPVANNNDGP
jgi:outer membrane biosynthesis protein TonB